MNKYKYALDNIVGANYSGDYPEESELLLQELVDKATPKKPIKITKDELDVECPNCTENYMFLKTKIGWGNDYHNFNYCANCGQALDWSNDE